MSGVKQKVLLGMAHRYRKAVGLMELEVNDPKHSFEEQLFDFSLDK